MKDKCQRTFAVFYLLVTISTFTYAFDCYYCPNCLNNQRGIRLTARPEDWCYKVVWRSGPRNQQIVSRGASADCRQDVYNDQSMSIPGVFSGTARYCCQRHLCNSASSHVHFLFVFISLLFLLFIYS